MSARAIPACLLLSGCMGTQSALAPAGDQARALFSLLGLMLWVAAAVYAVVIAGLGWALWRAWRRRGADARGEAALLRGTDAALTRALPLTAGAIVLGLTVLITGSFFADRAVFATRAGPALEVRVTGHQWWWRIQYRDPAGGGWIETANELHLPQGQTVRLVLGAADVIHSFWVPNVAGKLDMIPGRTNRLDVTARRPGWYRGQCAEFCGTQHAHMAFDVRVESPAAFRAWLAAQVAPAAPSAGRGAAVFQATCAACHAIRGAGAAGRAGPDLTHVAARRSLAAGTLAMTRGNLQGWIAQPQAIKPGTSMPQIPLTPADADAVAAYLATLR
ncbi:cytochrome c oxidase subunit II [Sphingomonas sp. BK580]|uniref:cytochrome c oxidase subunit II n=1 Tax=Sphingomonas sp. BK580 TaxID=2586972 RepID=UPI0016088458|nr:cytochrome c oxidase subunit II [Sphingomonas sp. BK580]MBB3693809.1 cytochrome c oxidase subunit 2 [Sphingomonas sp. BK580]